jgi:hypothetical protein
MLAIVAVHRFLDLHPNYEGAWSSNCNSILTLLFCLRCPNSIALSLYIYVNSTGAPGTFAAPSTLQVSQF